MRRLTLGLALVAAASFLSMPVMAQEAAPDLDQAPDADSPSDQQIANMALVCVATYDLVLAKQPSGPVADDAADARDLAKSIYIEASQTDEDTADEDIARVDLALATAISSGKGDLNEYHSTCDSLLSDEDPDAAYSPTANIS
ncbi:MAG: hypothetical protein QM647_15990 [Asticcacaulis sp.]|uniref:hypothetical protein n=1 Tax=Asticcacaulis sp. TaxID=1872648 RepID=UPI0039E5287C